MHVTSSIIKPVKAFKAVSLLICGIKETVKNAF